MGLRANAGEGMRPDAQGLCQAVVDVCWCQPSVRAWCGLNSGVRSVTCDLMRSVKEKHYLTRLDASVGESGRFVKSHLVTFIYASKMFWPLRSNARGLKQGHVDGIRESNARVRPIRWVQSAPDKATTLFSWGTYLKGLASLGLTLLALWHSWHPCEPKKTPSTHLHHWFIIIVRLGVIPSAFAWVIASSGTWGPLWLWISCYSWWLSLPRWLGAVKEHWIAHVPSPAECWKVTLVDCSCHWVTSLVGRLLRRPFVGLGLWNTY
jgi:hypothetical protein